MYAAKSIELSPIHSVGFKVSQPARGVLVTIFDNFRVSSISRPSAIATVPAGVYQPMLKANGDDMKSSPFPQGVRGGSLSLATLRARIEPSALTLGLGLGLGFRVRVRVRV